MRWASFISSIALWGACFCPSTYAETAVPTVIATDSIDFFTGFDANASKSPTLAMVISMFIPGSGHHYLERNRSALAFFSADAAAVLGFFLCSHYSKKLAMNAAGFAWTHAGAQGSISSADDYFWKQVGNYMDVQDYNSVIDLDRLDSERKFTGEEQYWRWDSEDSKKRFNSIMSNSRMFHVVSSFCIGALVLDRIVAFIDIRTATRNFGTQQSRISSRHIKIRPQVSVSSSSIELLFAGTF